MVVRIWKKFKPVSFSEETENWKSVILYFFKGTSYEYILKGGRSNTYRGRCLLMYV